MQDEAHMFDVCLILHADHELNASTFTTRVVAGRSPECTVRNRGHCRTCRARCTAVRTPT